MTKRRKRMLLEIGLILVMGIVMGGFLDNFTGGALRFHEWQQNNTRMAVWSGVCFIIMCIIIWLMHHDEH